MQNLQIIRQNDLLCLKNATASSAEAWKKEGQFQTSSIALNETQIGQIVSLAFVKGTCIQTYTIRYYHSSEELLRMRRISIFTNNSISYINVMHSNTALRMCQAHK